jgi:alanine racemase
MNKYNWPKLMRPDLEAHIFSRAILDNVKNLKSLCRDDTKFCAVVKANAYGHGISEVVNILSRSDVDFFAVTSIYEALHIHEMAEGKPILILTPISSQQSVSHMYKCVKHQLHCVVTSIDAVKTVNSTLQDGDDVLNMHVNVETGMGRCGSDPGQAEELVKLIDSSPNTRLAGVFTHFATADEEDLTYAFSQLETFKKFLADNNLNERDDVIIHAANSAATIKIPESHFDMVRCGVSMYGYFSRPMSQSPIVLKPAMKLQAPITGLKIIPAGESVSYGRSFIAQRDVTVGIVPLGYADGYWRGFSNTAKMKVAGSVVNVIGRVCMDQLLIDVTDVPDVRLGQMVTIIDNDQNSPCGAYTLADKAGTIAYEILTCIHAHVNRIVHS